MRLGHYLSIEERIQLLEERGLIIENEQEARQFLENVDYYRLIRYVSVFQSEKDCFHSGITFLDITNVYDFDKNLRKILFDVVDTIEISVRAHIIKHVGQKFGAFGHLDAAHFSNKRSHRQFLVYLKDKLEQRIAEEVIDDRRRTRLNDVPIWQAMELCTFNMLMNFYGLLPMKMQEMIAESYGCKQDEFVSWMNAFVVLRNITAHHGRLFDRRFENNVIWQSIDQLTFEGADSCSFVAVLYAVRKVMHTLDIEMYQEITENLKRLFDQYPLIQKQWLGSDKEKVWNILLNS
ncbi:MAG: Abi family protein [Culicoidibacterales bacterium]